MKGILKRGNADYHLVQNRLSSVCCQRVLENRVLREVLGPKREEVTRDWTKLDEGRYDL
jgi:hypothetical protein